MEHPSIFRLTEQIISLPMTLPMRSLRRFKDDVKEVADGYECGVGLDRFNDIKVGDILEAFVMEEIPQ